MFVCGKHDFEKLNKRVSLATPTMHGLEMKYMQEAYETNWMSTVGKNIRIIEQEIAERIGCKYAVALSSGTAAIHMCIKLAGIDSKSKVAASDMTFAATVNPIAYEHAEAVFVDTEYDTWNMDPIMLEKAFELYPDIKAVVVAHLYGTPAKIDEIKAICDKHGAILIEDAAESLGATYNGKQTGTFGRDNAISFNGNKIITGSSGGVFLTDSKEDYEKVVKWSTQSRENASWYQHTELGYNYRMSNVVAGVVRGQLPYLDEHIRQKKNIYFRYKDAFEKAGLPVMMNPYDEKKSEPNYWLSCMLINADAMCKQERSDSEASFIPEHGKSCPTEILQALESINAEGRPIWKPMHMQPIYKNNPFVSAKEKDENTLDVGMDIFNRGLCLPSDNKMTEEQQDRIIEVIISCFE